MYYVEEMLNGSVECKKYNSERDARSAMQHQYKKVRDALLFDEPETPRQLYDDATCGHDYAYVALNGTFYHWAVLPEGRIVG